MNTETTPSASINTPEEMAEIAIAFRDGRKLEMTHTWEDKWKPVLNRAMVSGVTLNFSDFRYRIAREPRRVWINVYAEGDLSPAVYLTRASADIDHNRVDCLEFVEVMK